MGEQVETLAIYSVRLGLISTHFLEVAGHHIGVTIALLWIAEEFIALYKEKKEKHETRNRHIYAGSPFARALQRTWAEQRSRKREDEIRREAS